MEAILQHYFHFSTFRPGQKEVLSAILQGKDVLAIMPTGQGKSLCYQYPAYVRPGSILIVSPLLSLINDQVQKIQERGEKAVLALTSQLSREERQFALQHLASYRYIFISPELLQEESIQQALFKITLQLFVVDEAHCITQWGVDFRPAYYHLAQAWQRLGKPQLLALTATATAADVQELKAVLFQKRPVTLLRFSVKKPQLAYQVVKVANDEKEAYCLRFIEQYAGPGIFYFSSREKAEQFALLLRLKGYRAASYHGAMKQAERLRIQLQFIHEEVEILCATTAFGMGVDKPNVRFVVHYHLPSSLEAYVQEAGRAGRDGKPALALLLYDARDIQRQKNFIAEAYYELATLFSTPEAEQSDLQRRWLLCLAKERNSQAYLRFFAQKEQEQLQKLRALLAYVETPFVYSDFIQAYFSEALALNWRKEEAQAEKILAPRKQQQTQASLSAQACLQQLFAPALTEETKNSKPAS